MKYTAKFVGDRQIGHAFSGNRPYDDRQVKTIARRNGLTIARPNGDRRYRGSRRLVLSRNGKPEWNFTAVEEPQEPRKVLPIRVGFL
jgi:hypothetical protein